eukprot:gene27370-30937_t
MTEAGFMGAPARCDRRGAAPGFCASTTRKATASRGTLARARAASTSGGRAWAR